MKSALLPAHRLWNRDTHDVYAEQPPVSTTSDIAQVVEMNKTTRDLTLPTTITGSLPRPTWYTENLGARRFRDALADARYREQYTDAVGSYIRDQERAGLDIVTDGDARFDN